MDILQKLTEEFKLKNSHVNNIITLIDEGNTIPFIARYRKELTGSLDDQILRELSDRLTYLRNMEDKRNQILNTIEEQGNMTDEIRASLVKSETLTELEDIYRPFKPKRRTRATIAKEKGLDGLANEIFKQETKMKIEDLALEYVNEEKDVATVKDAIDGAKDIVAEIIADDPKIRKIIRDFTFESGTIFTKLDNKDVKKEENTIFEMYYDFHEPVKKIAGHRVLAVNRGESEKIISVKLEVSEDDIRTKVYNLIVKNNENTKNTMSEIIEDSYKRLIAPSVEREIRSNITEKAEEGAIKVFAENLRQLLLQSPIKYKNVMALDPAFRTGCKVAVIDETGKVLDVAVIYPTPPKSKIEESKKVLKELIAKHDVDLIAIGNGTASRETEVFAVEMIKEIDKNLYYVIVNEAGASVYSASKLGAEEFPDFDVALRSAVSIGRRLQDPLAELVKIDPKSIGVGQYQHDMNQKRLSESLSGVVESCVNNVGVDLNMASPSLLSYVAGISPVVSKNILKYREENGIFKTRKELLKVAKLGPKAFEQAAGFLRIAESKNPLDNSGVHPESYKIAEQLLKISGFTLDDVKNNNVSDLDKKLGELTVISEKLEVGIPTLKDIMKELEKPGRDPREDVPPPILRQDVLSMEDLKEGMVLQGTVRNIIDFGAFVDIGVHQDGLVHISEICDKYIKHPLEVLSVSDIVKVRVISVDSNKKRISLSMKGIK